LEGHRTSKCGTYFPADAYPNIELEFHLKTLSRIAGPALLCGISLIILPFGCSSPDNDTPRVALVMKSLANEFFSTMENGAKEHHKAHADQYQLIVNGIKDESDLAQQVSLVNEMIVSGVDAIVIAPADSKALADVCKRAQDAGIVVVNIDNKLDEEVLGKLDASIPFVGPDNRIGAKLVGQYLASQLQAGDEVAILEGIPTAFNAQQRKLGFEDAMSEANIKIVDSQSGQWEIAMANTVAAAMLGSHPNLKALLCANDSMALGASAAVAAAGREGQVAIVGFDNISAVQEAIREGKVVATADQHGDQLAVFGIEAALGIINGKQKPEDQQTPVDLVTAESLR
jgi:ribose transport system substrate-binding protein